MLAWAADQGSAGGVNLREVPDPVPSPDQVLIQVEAFAPNPGDLAALAGAPSGSIPGWDGSGTVLEPAADGQGPQVGERVIFLGLDASSWAQRRVVPHAIIATAPEDSSFEYLATLPVPATSALRAVRKFGSVLGRRLLIVGATSSVGRYAVQLASRSGARVIAVARDESQHAALRRLGARETHASLVSVTTRVHGAIDMIGGQHLVDAFALLEPGATVIALGHAAESGEHFPYGALVADPATSDRTISTFFLGSEPGLAAEMSYLTAETDLDPGELTVRSWSEVGAWIEDGAPRQPGRPVFRVEHAGAT